MNKDDLSEINKRLDALQAAQLAMLGVIGVLLIRAHGDIAVVGELKTFAEHARVRMLSSQATDYQLQAFEEVIETIIEQLGG